MSENPVQKELPNLVGLVFPMPVEFKQPVTLDGGVAGGYVTVTVPTGGATIADGVDSVVLSLQVNDPGLYIFTGNLLIQPLTGPINARLQIIFNGSVVAEICYSGAPSAHLSELGFSCASYAVVSVWGDLIEMHLLQDSGASQNIAGATLNAIRQAATP